MYEIQRINEIDGPNLGQSATKVDEPIERAYEQPEKRAFDRLNEMCERGEIGQYVTIFKHREPIECWQIG